MKLRRTVIHIDAIEGDHHMMVCTVAGVDLPEGSARIPISALPESMQEEAEPGKVFFAYANLNARDGDTLSQTIERIEDHWAKTDGPLHFGPNIPGTRVPDTPIHRASLWLEDLKWGERRTEKDDKPEDIGDLFERFAEHAPNLTVEQMEEAANYYGANMARAMFGNRVSVIIPSPTGEGLIDTRTIMASLWVDAFMHGYATALAKRGLSNEEISDGQEG